MEWHEAAESLLRQKFGWLTPKGDIIPCTLHTHLQALKAAGHFVAEIDELAELTPEAIRRDCEKLSAEYGDTNAEWHRLETVETDYERARLRLMHTLYDAHWVRLGVRRNPGLVTIDAEGSERGMVRARRHLLDLAECTGATVAPRVLNRIDGAADSMLEAPIRETVAAPAARQPPREALMETSRPSTGLPRVARPFSAMGPGRR